MDFSLQTPDTAKRFLVAKVVEQSKRDGVALSDTERDMLLFSEISPCSNQTEIARQFETECGDSEYETKITKILRHAYAHDKRIPERRAEWENAMRALRAEDFYGLVMVDQAGIPRPKSWSPLLKMIHPQDVLFAIFVLGMLGIAATLLSDKLAVTGRLPDWAKILLCGICLYAVWSAGRIYGRIRAGITSASRSEN